MYPTRIFGFWSELGIYVVSLRILYRKFPNIAYLHLIRPKPDRLLVENFFCQIKAFRRIGTRYEKTDKGFAAMIYLAATVLWTK